METHGAKAYLPFLWYQAEDVIFNRPMTRCQFVAGSHHQQNQKSILHCIKEPFPSTQLWTHHHQDLKHRSLSHSVVEYLNTYK